MRRGEIWWMEHPRLGRRPVCVLTRDEAIPLVNEVVVVPATTTDRRIPTEVGLEPDDGMPKACVLSLDNLLTASTGILTERITTLSPARMHQVCEALRIATGC